MYYNPFSVDITSENDLEDFKMPYRLYSKTDYEVMKRKYQELNKYSYGYIVRLGISKSGNR